MKNLVLALAFLGLFMSSPIPVSSKIQEKESPGSHISKEKELEPSLRKAVNKLLGTIRRGDSEQFLTMFSRGNVNIGIDNELSYDEIAKAFKERGPLYCHYFDTDCLRKHLEEIGYKPAEDLEGTLPLPISYREIVGRVAGLEISQADVRYHPSKFYGVVTVTWKTPKPREVGLVEFFDFTFVLEDGEWRLSSDSTF